MTWIDGVDASFDALTLEKGAALLNAGYKVFWQCLWTGGVRPDNAITNLELAKSMGFIICGYISVAPHHDGLYHAQRGRLGIPDDLWEELALVPCDVELEGIPNQMVRDCVEAIASFGKRRAIYTAFFAWVGQQGDPHDFTDCLLCNAYWDGSADFDFPSLPFGGWAPEQVVCEQYTGGGDVYGLNADKDEWNQELLLPEERVKYTDEKLDAIFPSILQTLGHALDLATIAGGAIYNHVATHPGGGGTITTMGELEGLRVRIENNQRELEAFKAAIAAASLPDPVPSNG